MTGALTKQGFPGGSVSKESICNAGDIGDAGSISGLGKYPGGGNGNPLQYSCLKNPMDRRAWWAIVHVVAKRQTRLGTELKVHCTLKKQWAYEKR